MAGKGPFDVARIEEERWRAEPWFAWLIGALSVRDDPYAGGPTLVGRVRRYLADIEAFVRLSRDLPADAPPWLQAVMQDVPERAGPIIACLKCIEQHMEEGGTMARRWGSVSV